MKHALLLPLTLAFALPAISCTAAPKAASHTAAVKAAPVAAQTPIADRPFSDVPPGHWAAAAVETLRRRGIVVGYPAETHSAKWTGGCMAEAANEDVNVLAGRYPEVSPVQGTEYR